MWCLFVALVALPASAEDLSGLEEALANIESRFPAEVRGEALYRAALEGVAQHLGAVMGVSGNSVLTEAEHHRHEQWLSGHRTGIGAEFSIVGGRGLLITTVFKEGPADTADLHTGDLVVSMNDHPFTGLSPAAIHARVRHLQGPSSVLDLRRRDGAIRRITIKRGSFQLPAVRPVDGVGHTPVLRVPFFGRGTADALAAWLRDQRSASAIVLDLRDNEGGVLDEVIKAADLFLEPGAIVVKRGRERAAMEAIMATTPVSWQRDVVVLVNQGTQGGAEAFAAALRDNGRCVLVGTRTGGRAVDTTIYPAGRGFVLAVADTHLAAPSGASWSERGLVPNVVVESPQVAIPARIVGGVPDLQRDAAIRLISSALQY